MAVCENCGPHQTQQGSSFVRGCQQPFDNYKKVAAGVPAENVFNYDETNLQENPGKLKKIFSMSQPLYTSTVPYGCGYRVFFLS